jgi:acyl-CoA thioester hydrolase
MNIMWYVGKFDEANWNLFARLGLTPSYLRQSGRGMAAVQQNIAYKRELLAGDIVEVRSRLLELRENRSASAKCTTPRPARSPRPARLSVHMDRRRGSPQPEDESATPRQISGARAGDGVRRSCRASNRKIRTSAASPLRPSAASRRCTLGFTIARMEPGEVDLAMGYSPALTQQNGFVHAGSSPPASMLPAALPPCADAGGPRHLTVEFKTNPLAPASARSSSAPRSSSPVTLTIAEARACAARRRKHLIASMTGTLMAMARREPVQKPQAAAGLRPATRRAAAGVIVVLIPAAVQLVLRPWRYPENSSRVGPCKRVSQFDLLHPQGRSALPPARSCFSLA